ncbi:MAG: hypothetical protein AAB090_07105 [Nitrospirota bacterium]
MKKVILGFFLVIVFYTLSFAQKQDTLKIDGNDWKTWGLLEKKSFIAGFLAGSGQVVGENIYPLPKDFTSEKALDTFFISTAEKNSSFSRDDVLDALDTENWHRNMQIIRYGIYDITDVQIVDGLNSLYEDFKNRSIKLRDAVYVVKKQIKGAPAEHIERILRYLRGDKQDVDLLKIDRGYRDKEKGRVEFIEFP